MGINKLAQQKEITIGATSYILQMASASWYLDAVDSCKDENGNMMSGQYMSKVLANIVASPRLTIDDFTGKIYVLRNLVKEAEKFILGEELKVVEGRTEEETRKNETRPEETESSASGFSGV